MKFKIIMATLLVALTGIKALFDYSIGNIDVSNAELFSFGLSIIILIIILTHEPKVKK